MKALRTDPDSTLLADSVLEVVKGLSKELRPEKTGRRITLASTLDHDLGLDSLAIAELILRLERAFGVQLPEQLLRTANTPAELVAAICAARSLGSSIGSPSPMIHSIRQPSPTPIEDDLAPLDATTLQEVLAWHVKRHPDRVHVQLLDKAGAAKSLTYSQIEGRSSQVALALCGMGVERGDRVAIMLPTGEDFFAAFLGALLTGGVPVPIYPPFRLSRLEDHLRRQAKILRNAGAVVLLTTMEAKPAAGLLRSLAPNLRRVETLSDLVRKRTNGLFPKLKQAGPEAADPRLAAETALIQYTSGSTGDPKGVVLSHNNLLSNIRAMGEVLAVSASDVFVSWLPLYHDMGLIGAWLGSLYFGGTLVVMSPLTFLARPVTWLQAIHRYGGTLTASPNFGYELCLGKIEDAEIEGLDLKSVRFMMNGAEPVSASTLERFQERFEPYGLAPEALAPVYGLAESSVGVAFPPLGRPPLIDRIDRDALAQKGLAVPAREGVEGVIGVVACGRPLPGHQIRVVDEFGRELGERHEGRLEFRGPSCTSGYFENLEKTNQLFRQGWLDSGDRAYFAEGDVYLTGRIKDILIRAGRNIYPQEIEQAVGQVDGVRKGCVAVFGSQDKKAGTERIVLVAETRLATTEDLQQLHERVDEVASTLLEGSPDVIVLTAPRTVPKTSSGKIRRAACRELFEANQLEVTERSVGLQLTRVWFAGTLSRARRAIQSASAFLFAAWFWAIAATLLPVAWILVMVVPGRSLRWRVTHGVAKVILFVLGLRPRVEGRKNLPKSGGIVVANHSSYFDGIVLAAILPGEVAFTVKQEVASQFFGGTMMRRLGALFFERFDAQRGVENTQQAESLAKSGARLVFFPEGTLDRFPGLLAFHLGAFLVAARSAQPVVPVTLRGTRSILRGGQWFPRRGVLEVVISEPILPRDASWNAAIKLRDETRAVLLRHCHEPDVGGEHVVLPGAAGPSGTS